MGELLRRYWQPACTSDELRDLLKKVKLLCEELIVFRDKSPACVSSAL
jgi:phenylpropionate dioxygenase-like ring-hydroxylating dioxygenase large terminal subunit